MWVVLFLVSLRELVFWVWWSVSLWTPRCYFVAIVYLLSSVWVSCWINIQLLERMVYSVARFALISVRSDCVVDVMFHMLLPEFDILELRPQLIHWSSKYQGVERLNMQGVSCRPMFICGITFPTHCCWHRNVRQLVFKWALNRWLLDWVLFFLVLRGAGACRVAKKIYKHLFSPIGAMLLVVMIPITYLRKFK